MRALRECNAVATFNKDKQPDSLEEYLNFQAVNVGAP
jgi:hypothetical protein